MTRVAYPIAEAWREECKKHPEGGKKLSDAMDKRIAEIKQISIKEKKQGELQYRSILSWVDITNQKELDNACHDAAEEYRNGNFFVERIGRYHAVDFPLVATLLNLRNRWIEEYEIKTAPEFILLDMALASYWHFIRLNEAVGNIMASIEWDVFALDAPAFEVRDVWGKRPYGARSDKAVAVELAHRLNEVLQPVLDQFNRMFIRNLKAIRDLKRGNIQLNIGNVGQMNIGEKQINIEKNV
ncbi:MAG: hypothetical protein Q8R55_03950 [Candidatus Taylorbacteria bacterium]|nr:hypothetical protein [Candidatus Taylorbacteria bacterium]